MTNSKNERIALFEQRTPHSLAIDLVAMQDQRDALAAQLQDATKQIGAMAEALRESKRVMASAYLHTPENCPVDDRLENTAARIDALLAGQVPAHPVGGTILHDPVGRKISIPRSDADRAMFDGGGA